MSTIENILYYGGITMFVIFCLAGIVTGIVMYSIKDINFDNEEYLW